MYSIRDKDEYHEKHGIRNLTFRVHTFGSVRPCMLGTKRRDSRGNHLRVNRRMFLSNVLPQTTCPRCPRRGGLFSDFVSLPALDSTFRLTRRRESNSCGALHVPTILIRFAFPEDVPNRRGLPLDSWFRNRGQYQLLLEVNRGLGRRLPLGVGLVREIDLGFRHRRLGSHLRRHVVSGCIAVLRFRCGQYCSSMAQVVVEVVAAVVVGLLLEVKYYMLKLCPFDVVYSTILYCTVLYSVGNGWKYCNAVHFGQ